MPRLAFYFDANACSGCKTCQVSCKDKHDLPVGILWRRVYEVTGGEWKQSGVAWENNVFAYNVSLACNHCEDPICLKNCPSKAITKRDDGIVEINPKVCLGCRYCEWVCPYGAPQFNEEKGTMTKCDMCADYVDAGKNPSCVDSCPMRAIDFGDFDELMKKYGDRGEIYPLPNRQHTKPSILVKPHRNAPSVELVKPEVSNREDV